MDEYLTLYALEGFLNRLSQSQRRNDFVLKGGVLLAAFDERRPTRDVDLAALCLDNEVDGVLEVLREVAATVLDDGLEIDVGNATAATIRDNSASYTGARVTFPVEMVIAEKLVTAVQRSAVNTRWRDFVDMHRLSNSRSMSGAVLVESCATVGRIAAPPSSHWESDSDCGDRPRLSRSVEGIIVVSVACRRQSV